MKLEAGNFYIVSKYYVLLYSDIPQIYVDGGRSRESSGAVYGERATQEGVAAMLARAPAAAAMAAAAVALGRCAAAESTRQNLTVTFFPPDQPFLAVMTGESDMFVKVVVGEIIGWIVNRSSLEPELWKPE